MEPTTVHILSVCRHGAGRSQIAASVIAAALRGVGPLPQFAGLAVAVTRVAGTSPLEAARPVPEVIVGLLVEIGLEPVQQNCIPLTEEDVAAADRIICFAEQDTWPSYLAAHPQLSWYCVADGKGRSVQFQRAMRDEVVERARTFLTEWSRG